MQITITSDHVNGTKINSGLKAVKAVSGSKACLISFHIDEIPGVPVRARPYGLFAYREEILSDEPPKTHDGAWLCVFWVPTSDALSPERESAWLASSRPVAAEKDSRMVKAGIRTIHVAWFDGRAVIRCNASDLKDALDATIRFVLAERETSSLERRMADMWPHIKEHTPLTHGRIPFFARKLVQQVAALTETAADMSASILQLQTALEQLDPALETNSKRLYDELILQARIWDRLEMLEDPIELAVDHYELVNTRIIEARNASNELAMGVAIIALLLLEIIVITGHQAL